MKKIVSIISVFIEHYELNALAIKRLNPRRSSSNLNKLVRRIIDLAERKNLKVYQYSIKDMETFFSGEKINRKKLAEAIASEYPILFHELNKEKAHKNPYYLRMFEAVALGSICFNQLDNH